MKHLLLAFFLLLLGFNLSACGATSTAAPQPGPVDLPPGQPTQTLAPSDAPTQAEPTTPPTPTSTPEPMALTVNGEGVTMVEFQAEMAQIKEAHAAAGKTLPVDEEKQQVIESLTSLALLAQGAAANGYTLDDAALQAEVDRLAEQMGGPEALKAWQARYGYTESAFRDTLRRSLMANWQRNQITATVPEEAEQVHVRQILVTDEASAKIALQQVNIAGADFSSYAFAYDPLSGGDLGWFPRGYLIQPEVEEAAFALETGKLSEIVQSEVGFHILKVLGHEIRPLSPDARRVAQRKAVENWLEGQRAQSQVEVLAP